MAQSSHVAGTGAHASLTLKLPLRALPWDLILSQPPSAPSSTHHSGAFLLPAWKGVHSAHGTLRTFLMLYWHEIAEGSEEPPWPLGARPWQGEFGALIWQIVEDSCDHPCLGVAWEYSQR